MATTKKNTGAKSTVKSNTTKKETSVKVETPTVENTVPEILENNETQGFVNEQSPIVSFKAKKAIPMDALVMVKSAVNGKLVYVSKRQNGYREIWNGLGEEIPMEMAELYSMKNTDKSFFTENWIEVDPVVLRDLQMERYYKDAISVSDLDAIFELEGEELEDAIDRMKDNTKNAFALEAIRRIEEEELTDFRTISTIEKKLNCELYEH